MIEKRCWFQRPLASYCLLAAIAVLSVYTIINADKGQKSRGEANYRITIRHYGIDANEMETSTAIPLEDALSAIPGANRIMTISENGRVRAFVNFPQKRRFLSKGGDDYYDAVREAAQRVYETLPSSAQRPELGRSGDYYIPFWTAAVYAQAGAEAPDAALLERTIKPALGSIDGAGEVEIAGPGIKEIVILLDEEKTAMFGLSPAKISGSLASNDAFFAGGSVLRNGLEIPIGIYGRYKGINELKEALIPLESGGYVKLDSLGEVREMEREGDTISRLNGKKTAIISVTAVSGADTRVLSNRIKKEIEKLSYLPLEIHVLEDRGADEAAAFRSVFIAALEASLFVAAAVILLGWGRSSGFRNAIICAAAIPLISIISAAVLSAAGFPVNRKFLAGLAIGVGCAVDAVILSAEGFGKTKNPGAALKRIWPPLVSASATSIAAILPLLAITGAEDITVIAGALGIVTIVSAVLALTLLPPLFLWESKPLKKSAGAFKLFGLSVKNNIPRPFRAVLLIKKTSRKSSRFLAGLFRFCVKKPFICPVLSLLISAAAVLSLIAAGADTSGEWAEDSVYVQIEFDGGFLKEEADVLLASWAEELNEHIAVREVQTSARTGSGHAFVAFDMGKTKKKIKIGELRELVRSKTIPGAFIYIPEPSPGDRIWKISVSGDDAVLCRELARSAASIISSAEHGSANQPVKETVLNFKQGGPKLTLYPRREALAQAGVFFSSPADTVRRGIHGPVAYKRNEEGKDTDVRLRFRKTMGADEIINIPIAAANTEAVIRTGALMEAAKTREVSVIQRENRRRTASLSIRTGPGDPRSIRDRIMNSLKELELPPGYKIEFDPDAIRQAEALAGKFLNFLWALLFCYMIIAAAEESFVLPLVILSLVPPSLAIPVMALVFSGAQVNAITACALIAVSCMTVNAGVISAGELWRNRAIGEMSFYRLLKGRLPVLLATTCTTIAGGLPFLFLREGNNAVVRTLALVTVLGVGTSFFCSITLVPSLVNLYSRFTKSGSAWRNLTKNKETYNEA